MSSDLKIGVLLNFFLVFFFFFHFFGLHWMKLRSSMLKILGFFLERRGKKEEKAQLLWKKEKNLKKKGPDGIRTRDLRFYRREFETPVIRDRRLTTWPPSHTADLHRN